MTFTKDKKVKIKDEAICRIGMRDGENTGIVTRSYLDAHDGEVVFYRCQNGRLVCQLAQDLEEVME